MRILVLFVLAVSVSGCSRIADSRANPLNWFGDKQQSETTASPQAVVIPSLIPSNRSGTAQFVDQRALISRVISMEVNNTSGGVLVTAQGQPDRAGGFNLELVPTGSENGVLTLEFRIGYPQTATSGSVNALTSSRFVKESDLAGVRQIRVVSAQNSISRRN